MVKPIRYTCILCLLIAGLGMSGCQSDQSTQEACLYMMGFERYGSQFLISCSTADMRDMASGDNDTPLTSLRYIGSSPESAFESFNLNGDAFYKKTIALYVVSDTLTKDDHQAILTFLFCNTEFPLNTNIVRHEKPSMVIESVSEWNGKDAPKINGAVLLVDHWILWQKEGGM